MRITGYFLIAAVLATAVIGGASAQNTRADRSPATTGTIPPAAVGLQAGLQEWTGESGASGHPLMTAEAIRHAAANFRPCLERLWPLAARRGITRGVFQTYTAQLSPDLRIM